MSVRENTAKFMAQYEAKIATKLRHRETGKATVMAQGWNWLKDQQMVAEYRAFLEGLFETLKQRSA